MLLAFACLALIGMLAAVSAVWSGRSYEQEAGRLWERVEAELARLPDLGTVDSSFLAPMAGEEDLLAWAESPPGTRETMVRGLDGDSLPLVAFDNYEHLLAISRSPSLTPAEIHCLERASAEYRQWRSPMAFLFANSLARELRHAARGGAMDAGLLHGDRILPRLEEVRAVFLVIAVTMAERVREEIQSVDSSVARRLLEEDYHRLRLVLAEGALAAAEAETWEALVSALQKQEARRRTLIREVSFLQRLWDRPTFLDLVLSYTEIIEKLRAEARAWDRMAQWAKAEPGD
ncbi:MAG: hypothetical protein H8E31_02435 [Planctomycetes bacterium]|nr:hypothetical protein [Planctomycetota bacterium]